MEKILLYFSHFATCFLLLTNATAEQLLIYGARPLALGGSYTGIAEKAISGYWNPAGLGGQKTLLDLQLPIGLGVAFSGDILSLAYDLKQAAKDYEEIRKAQETGGFITLQQLSTFSSSVKKLNKLNSPDMGVLGNILGGLAVRIGQLNISANNYTYVGMDPNIDLYGLWLGASSPEGIDLSKIITTGVSTTTPSGIPSETVNDLSSFMYMKQV